MKNFYEVLQVRTNATQMQIKKAYIDLMTKYHPDVYKGDKNYAQRYTSVITEAYAVLKDENRRKVYDVRHNINPRPNTWQLKREDREIDRQKKIRETNQNYEHQVSREYFKNTVRKNPKKNFLKRMITSKLFYGVLILVFVEIVIAALIYYT